MQKGILIKSELLFPLSFEVKKVDVSKQSAFLPVFPSTPPPPLLLLTHKVF